MGEVTLRLQIDRQTGKRDVIISYKSDAGALSLEHEQEHRALVDQLIQGGALKASELGAILVRRDEDQASAPASESPVGAESAAALSTKA